MTHIHMYAAEGNLEKIECELSKGTDINLRAEITGTTPLHRSVEIGHKEVVEYLLRHGANIYIIDNFNYSVLYLAVLGILKNVRNSQDM